jgi:hypothetical protein
MPPNDAEQQAQILSESTGIIVPEARLTAIALGAKTLRTSIDACLAFDLPGIEPASRFLPPPPQ